MKKILLTLSLFITVCGIAMADGNAFTPLNFDDTTFDVNSGKATATTASDVKLDPEAIGNGNMQSAIQQLDNAQIDIRNELVNYKTKFADIDAQYKLVKSERKAALDKVRATERRIKAIEREKERIRKSMI